MKAGEDVDCVTMPKASSLRAHVFVYPKRDGYDMKLVNIDGFTWAMPQVNGLGSLAPKSDIIDQEKGTHYGYYNEKHLIHDINKRTLGTTNSKWKEPTHDK
ncbi:La-related protein 6 [Hordeum vulgare]|nr:La-related protein 6 [Hordeum vulgare]